MKQLCRKKQLQHFWAKCVDNVVLYANSETLLAHLERCYGPEIRETYDINAGKGTKLPSTETVSDSLLSIVWVLGKEGNNESVLSPKKSLELHY